MAQALIDFIMSIPSLPTEYVLWGFVIGVAAVFLVIGWLADWSK